MAVNQDMANHMRGDQFVHLKRISQIGSGTCIRVYRARSCGFSRGPGQRRDKFWRA